MAGTLIGLKFGRLCVIGQAENDKKNRLTRWVCQCECGNQCTVRRDGLTTGHSTSCGCLRKEKVSAATRKHGASVDNKDLTYASWRSMRSRCSSNSSDSRVSYKVKGITICERWQNYQNFLEDMGVRPSSEHSIDRIDSRGNYCPENCRWATAKEQARNSLSNRLIAFKGQTKCLTEWAEIIGITAKGLSYRLKAWPLELALTSPPNRKVRRVK